MEPFKVGDRVKLTKNASFLYGGHTKIHGGGGLGTISYVRDKKANPDNHGYLNHVQWDSSEKMNSIYTDVDLELANQGKKTTTRKVFDYIATIFNRIIR